MSWKSAEEAVLLQSANDLLSAGNKAVWSGLPVAERAQVVKAVVLGNIPAADVAQVNDVLIKLYISDQLYNSYKAQAAAHDSLLIDVIHKQWMVDLAEPMRALADKTIENLAKNTLEDMAEETIDALAKQGKLETFSVSSEIGEISGDESYETVLRDETLEYVDKEEDDTNALLARLFLSTSTSATEADNGTEPDTEAANDLTEVVYLPLTLNGMPSPACHDPRAMEPSTCLLGSLDVVEYTIKPSKLDKEQCDDLISMTKFAAIKQLLAKLPVMHDAPQYRDEKHLFKRLSVHVMKQLTVQSQDEAPWLCKRDPATVIRLTFDDRELAMACCLLVPSLDLSSSSDSIKYKLITPRLCYPLTTISVRIEPYKEDEDFSEQDYTNATSELLLQIAAVNPVTLPLTIVGGWQIATCSSVDGQTKAVDGAIVVFDTPCDARLLKMPQFVNSQGKRLAAGDKNELDALTWFRVRV